MYEYNANLKGAVQTSLAIAAASSATIPATAALLPWRVLWSALTAAHSATMCATARTDRYTSSPASCCLALGWLVRLCAVCPATSWVT